LSKYNFSMDEWGFQAEGPIAQGFEEYAAKARPTGRRAKLIRLAALAATRDHTSRSKAADTLKLQAKAAGEQWKYLLDRIGKITSEEHIGWLEASTKDTCIDETPLFSELLEQCENGTSVLPKGYTYLFVAGLFNEFYPGYLREAVEHFNEMGAVALLSGARGDSLTRDNAVRILAEVETLYENTNRPVVLVGHSKGGLDSIGALGMYEDRLKDKVAGVVTVQSPYGGSAIAEDLLADRALAKTVAAVLEMLVGLPSGQGASLVVPIEDLRYEARKQFVRTFPLPERFPCVSFHSSTTAASSLLFAPAAYFRQRYNCASDGLVATCDAEVPGARVVRYEEEFDHLDAAFPPQWSPELLTPDSAAAPASKLARSPPVGKLIVRTASALNASFKERKTNSPAASHVMEALAALLVIEVRRREEERAAMMPIATPSATAARPTVKATSERKPYLF